MLRLEVTGNDGSRHSLDLYENAPVNLNYQFTELHNFGVPQGSYSQTFRIPATGTNKIFFGEAQDVNTITDDDGYVQNLWSARKRIPAELTYRSIPLARGYVQFKKAYIVQRDLAEYEIVFFGDVLDATKSLGDKMLTDLDLTEWNHNLTIDNIQSSWAGTLLGGDIRYALIDRGWHGMNWSGAGWGVSPFATTKLLPSSFTPCMRVSTLVNEIFGQSGYTISSSFLDTEDDLYIPLTGELAYLFGDFQGSEGFKATGANLTEVGGVPNLGEAFDYGNNYSTTTQLYNVSFDCRIVMRLQIDMAAYGGSWSRPVIYKNGSTAVWQGPQVQSGSTYSTTVEFIVDVVAGDNLKFDVVGPAPDYLITTVAWESLSVFRISNAGANWLEGNLPVMKQIDLVKSLQKMFNWVIVPDQSIPNLLYIEPWDDYIGTGVTKDWSDKIDYSKDVVVEPTVTMQKKLYDWQFAPGEDLINKAVVDQLNRTWGRHQIQDTSNEFASGDYKVETMFTGFVTSYIPYTQVILHRLITTEGKPVKNPKPRLAYWNGTYNPTLTLPVNTGSSTTNLTTYGLFTAYSAYPAQLSDKALMFGGDQPFHEGVTQPLNTLWYTYYRTMFTEQYSVDSRMVTAYLRLTAADVNQFLWSDKVWIIDAYYRVHSINGFTANDEATTQCVLIKLLEPERDCTFIPQNVNVATNAVTFLDANGNTSNGNKFCCEYYGYQWVDGRCWRRTGSNDHEGDAGTNQSEIAAALQAQEDLQDEIDAIRIKTDYISISTAVDLTALQAQADQTDVDVDGIEDTLTRLVRTFIPKNEAGALQTKITYEESKTDGMSMTLTGTQTTVASATGRTQLALTESSPGVLQLNLQDQAATPASSTALYAIGNSGGNRIGINNTNPTATLDVTGTMRASSTLTTGGNVNGRNMTTDGTKLDGIQALAEVNQLAYSTISVNGTSVPANTKTSTFTLVEGSNITLTANAGTRSITIASTAAGGGGSTEESELFTIFYDH